MSKYTSDSPFSIVLTGTFCSLNLGDYSMQLSFIDQLSKILPEHHQIYICSPNPEIDAPRYGKNVKVIPSDRKNPLMMLRTISAMALNAITRRNKFSPGPESTAIKNSDLVVSISGDMLTEDYGVWVGVTHLYPLWIARHYKKRLFIIGQSIGPFNILRRPFQSVLRYSNAVTCRDEISFRYVKGLIGDKT